MERWKIIACSQARSRRADDGRVARLKRCFTTPGLSPYRINARIQYLARLVDCRLETLSMPLAVSVALAGAIRRQSGKLNSATVH